MTTTVPGMPHLTIAAVRWWAAAVTAGSTIGAVLVENTTMNTVKAYIGRGEGWDEHADAQLIASWGARLQPEIGQAMFPAFADREWAVDE